MLGLTGFAISQPLLSVAGENPELFTFNNVDGPALAVYALAVALVPPLMLWGLVVLVGLANRRAGDLLFIALAVVLAGLTIVQVLKAVRVSNAVLLAIVASLAAVAFGVALLRLRPAGTWLRITAVLPALAAVLFLVASPSGELLRSRNASTVREPGADLPPVVFLMLDELPTQTLLTEDAVIDAVRFPNLAALSAEATWYRNYSVNAPGTLQSIPALLTSTKPDVRPPLWTQYPNTLFSLLAPTHELEVSESVTQLCGYSDCAFEDSETGVESDDAHVRRLVDQTTELWVERISLGRRSDVDLGQFREEVTARSVASSTAADGEQAGQARDLRSRPIRVREFVDSLRPGDRPTFYYLHLVLPHQPWNFYPNGVEYANAGDEVLGAGIDASDEARRWGSAVNEQRLLWQAQYTDQLVGEVVARLRDIGLYDDATIVVTADHGVAVEARLSRRKAISEDTLDDVAYVPLIIKAPDQRRAQVDDSNLMGFDLLPTIADVVGVPVTFSTEGHAAGSRSVTSRGEEKEIYDFGSSFPAKFEEIVRFDSSSAPDSAHRLVGAQPAGASPLTGLVARLGIQDLLGTPLAELRPVPGGDAVLAGLEEMREPNPSEPKPAVVLGAVRNPMTGGQARVVIAVNGTIVSAAPVYEDGTFMTLLPEGALTDNNAINVVLLDGDEVIDLSLR
jgi:hypothetical protein